MVNDTTEKTAPKEAIDQIRECLSQIVHAFAETDPTAKIFMAKWDIKEGFWHMDCTEGEESNFAYVFPQKRGRTSTAGVAHVTTNGMGQVLHRHGNGQGCHHRIHRDASGDTTSA